MYGENYSRTHWLSIHSHYCWFTSQVKLTAPHWSVQVVGFARFVILLCCKFVDVVLLGQEITLKSSSSVTLVVFFQRERGASFCLPNPLPPVFFLDCSVLTSLFSRRFSKWFLNVL